MTIYKLYLLGFDGYLMGATSVECADDQAALAQADKLIGTFYAKVEVWEAERKVGDVDASSALPEGDGRGSPDAPPGMSPPGI